MNRPAICFAAVLAVLLATGASRPVAAQEDDSAAEARRRFEAGVALFQEGNPQGALLEFEASLRLRAVPVVQFNIAQSLKVLLRYEEAIEAYRRYLEMGGDEITAERRADVELTIGRLRQSIAHLDVCGAENATVRLDGNPVGRLPFARPLSVAAGRHEVELRLAGHSPANRTVELTGGETERVCLELLPIAVVQLAPPRRESGVLSRWWFWAAAGAVVAGGITAAVLLSAPEDQEPVRGNVDPEIVSAAWGY